MSTFFFFSTQQESHDESISHSYLNKPLSQWIPCVLCFCLEIPKRVIWTWPWDFLQGIYLNYVWKFSTCLEFLWHVINHVKLINVFFSFSLTCEAWLQKKKSLLNMMTISIMKRSNTNYIIWRVLFQVCVWTCIRGSGREPQAVVLNRLGWWAAISSRALTLLVQRGALSSQEIRTAAKKGDVDVKSLNLKRV